jgi:hypothetical protein
MNFEELDVFLDYRDMENINGNLQTPIILIKTHMFL